MVFSLASFLQYFASATIGILVSAGELVSRYRDDPLRALKSAPAILYLSINGLASLTALLFVHTFGVTFGSSSAATTDITQVLAAGFGAIAFFRTSLFNATAENEVIPIGPSVVLNVILGAVDRAVDRRMAERRSSEIASIMSDVSYTTSKEPLQLYCFELMQNAQPADRAAVETTVQLLDNPQNSSVPDTIKAYIFGLSLLNVVGIDVLREAVSRVKPHLVASLEDGAGNAAAADH